MSTHIQHHVLDSPFKFQDSMKEFLPVYAKDLALNTGEARVVECRLTFEVDWDIYQHIDSAAIFHLDRKVRVDSEGADFSPDKPIEIEARLNENLLAKIISQGDTQEEVASYLLELNQTKADDILFHTDSWYALYVKQLVDLPSELEGTGELKMGYRTTWAENEATEKITESLINESSKTEYLESISAEQPILKVVTDSLTPNGQPMYQWESDTVVSFPYKGKNGQWRCYADARDDSFLCCFYSIFPETAPEEQRLAMAEFMTRVNYTLTVGNFEMDFSDGEIRLKTSIDVEGDRLSMALFRQLTVANVTMMDRYLPGIKAIIKGDLSPEQASAQIESSIEEN